MSDSFFLVADSVGEGFEAVAEVGDLGGEAGEGAPVVAVVAVAVDYGPELGVAIEGGATDASQLGDDAEGDRFALVGQLGAGGLAWIHRFGGGASAKKASWAGRLLMFNVNDHSTTGGTFCVCIFAQIGPAFSDL